MTPDIENARYDTATLAYEQADFKGREVAGVSGWENDADGTLSRKVFFENPIGSTIPMQVSMSFEPGTSDPVYGLEFDLPEDPGSLYGYYVDCDERGEYRADLRNILGATVFEIASDDEGRIDLIEDGFMHDTTDLPGLEVHLRSIGVLAEGAQILAMPEFEKRIEAYRDNEPQLEF